MVWNGRRLVGRKHGTLTTWSLLRSILQGGGRSQISSLMVRWLSLILQLGIMVSDTGMGMTKHIELVLARLDGAWCSFLITVLCMWEMCMYQCFCGCHQGDKRHDKISVFFVQQCLKLNFAGAGFLNLWQSCYAVEIKKIDIARSTSVCAAIELNLSSRKQIFSTAQVREIDCTSCHS